MRRVGLFLAVIGTSIALTAAPLAASGHPPPGEQLHVSGSFTGTGTLASTCATFHQVVDGAGDWSDLGGSTFRLDFCSTDTPGTGRWAAAGTFTISTAEGQLSGDLSGSVDAEASFPPPDVGFPFDFDLPITGGTERFAGANGALTMTGAFGYGAFTIWGTVGGTLSLPPTTPKTRADCRMGGWRNFVDEDGKPFRSRGNCTAYVVRHEGD